MDALAGIDLGTTGCRAAVYSAAGQLLGESYVEYPLINLTPERVEQDANLWWTLAQQVVAEAARRAGPRAEVRGLSVSSQGLSFAPIDRHGKLLRNAISWLDARAGSETEAIRAQISDDALFGITGMRLGAYYTLPKLLWLRGHEPDLFARAHKFLMAHDVLVHKLCGACVTNYSLAGGSMLLDVSALDWSDRLLTMFGIERERLPELCWGGAVAGELTRSVAQALGLPEHLPVVVGGQDQKCAALGAGIRPGMAAVSLGTAAAVSCLVSTPAFDAMRRVPIFPFVVAGLWDVEGVIGTAGAALKWVRDTLFPGKAYEDLDAMALASPPGANGVRFYPHLTGATSPWWQVQARGVFSGLSLAAGAGDLVRSVLEGIAFQVKANLDVLATLAPVEAVILFGGGARSRLWSDLISQVADLPVYVPQTVEAATWGACLHIRRFRSATSPGQFAAGSPGGTVR
jgi:xylulokinase